MKALPEAAEVGAAFDPESACGRTMSAVTLCIAGPASSIGRHALMPHQSPSVSASCSSRGRSVARRRLCALSKPPRRHRVVAGEGQLIHVLFQDRDGDAVAIPVAD